MISKELLEKVRSELDAALLTIGAANGLQIRSGNCSYSKTTATFKLEVAEVSEDGEVASKFAEPFVRLISAWSQTLDADDLGFVFSGAHGVQFRVVGLNTRARKFPIVCESLEDGHTYKFTLEAVERAKQLAVLKTLSSLEEEGGK